MTLKMVFENHLQACDPNTGVCTIPTPLKENEQETPSTTDASDSLSTKVAPILTEK